MKYTGFIDDLFTGRNYEHNICSDCGSHTSLDRYLVSNTRGSHSVRGGQIREVGCIRRGDASPLRNI